MSWNIASSPALYGRWLERQRQQDLRPLKLAYQMPAGGEKSFGAVPLGVAKLAADPRFPRAFCLSEATVPDQNQLVLFTGNTRPR